MLQHAIMVEPIDSHRANVRKLNTPELSMNLKHKSAFDAYGALPPAQVDRSPQPSVRGQTLNLNGLNCFEVVERQFEEFGVIFGNAIALAPSNPAFPSPSGRIVLMGAPKSGWLEVSFIKPVRFVRGLVTSSRRTVLSAFDRNGNCITQTETLGPNLAGSESGLDPNAELTLEVPDIHRVSFYAFDGHLTVAEFTFGF